MPHIKQAVWDRIDKMLRDQLKELQSEKWSNRAKRRQLIKDQKILEMNMCTLQQLVQDLPSRAPAND